MPSITENHVRQLLTGYPAWQGRDMQISTLSGGLTNSNFRVDVDGTPYVVRIPGESTELLAIDRDNEYHNCRVAAELGIGPRIEHYWPDDHVTIMEFIEGRTLSQADMQAPGMPSRVAAVLKKLHGGPSFLHDFNMFRTTEFYLEVIRERQFGLPDDFQQRQPAIRRLHATLEANPIPLVACHNDLLAENFILEEESLRIIDFEYSGNNDPCFELGNFAQEQEYDHSQIDELCQAYFGDASANMVARTKLNMIVSDVAWSLWAMIQHEISKVDFDFHGYGLNRWRRAGEKFDSDDFAAWLEIK